MSVAAPNDAPPAASGEVANDATARLYNRLAGTQRDLSFPWAGQPARLRFVAPTQVPAPTGWLVVRCGEHRFELGLPALPEPAALGVAFAGIEFAALPPDLVPGVIEAWLEEPLAVALRQGVNLQPDAWQTSSSRLPAFCGWEVARGDAVPFLRGTLHADTAALTHLAGLVEQRPPTPARTANDIPFSISVAIAHLPLRVGELAALAPGDVLLLPLAAPEFPPASLELWTGGRCLGRASRQNQTVRLLTMTTSSETKPAATAATPLRVDDLPVQVTFDVGQIELSVGQLRTLGDGYTFELPVTAERAVTIRANGSEIGQGELVEVGTKVGVRVVSWSLA